MRRRPQMHRQETSRQVEKMLADGIIEPSSSPWASAYVVVQKQTGEYRICIDYRKLNSLTKKYPYPSPNLEQCLETLAGKRFFSSFDLASGYWQLPMAETSKPLTAFRCEDGHFQFRRMPFGLVNAPASFQKFMNSMLTGMKGLELQVYLDDVCIATSGWSSHITALKKFFTIVMKTRIKLKPSKCLIGSTEITFLGHVISERGIQQDPRKLAALTRLERPTNLSELRRVIGLVGSLMYLVITTRLDIALAVNLLARKQANSTNDDWIAAKRVLRYLKGTSTVGILYRLDGQSFCSLF